jgi:hypothetical protein
MSTLQQQLDEFQRNRRLVFYVEYHLVGEPGWAGYAAGPFATEQAADEYMALLLENDHEQRILNSRVQARRV